MLIRLGYDIELELSKPMAVVALLNVHPSRAVDLLEPDEIGISPNAPSFEYIDGFGNRSLRILAREGKLSLTGSTLIHDTGLPDPISPGATPGPMESIRTDILQFLLPSRYCEVDRLSDLAWSMFGNMTPGWEMVQAICDWVHGHITFDYNSANSRKSAMDVYAERLGVCRDFQHLAITMCRALHVPARYVTGYLGDIGVTLPPPMDFSAWFEVYLDGQWWAFDARNNIPRIGRVLMAAGRDAADVAITTTFGQSWLTKFVVVSDEVL